MVEQGRRVAEAVPIIDGWRQTRAHGAFELNSTWPLLVQQTTGELKRQAEVGNLRVGVPAIIADLRQQRTLCSPGLIILYNFRRLAAIFRVIPIK